MPKCRDLVFVVVMLVEASEGRRDVRCARTLFRPLWSNEISVCLGPLYSLFRSQRDVNVSVRGSLVALETKASHDAWFSSSSMKANLG